jgi:hypothetical protein
MVTVSDVAISLSISELDKDTVGETVSWANIVLEKTNRRKKRIAPLKNGNLKYCLIDFVKNLKWFYKLLQIINKLITKLRKHQVINCHYDRKWHACSMNAVRK